MRLEDSDLGFHCATAGAKGLDRIFFQGFGGGEIGYFLNMILIIWIEKLISDILIINQEKRCLLLMVM